MTWRGKVWEGLEGDVNKDSAGQVEDFNLESIGKIHHQTAIKFQGSSGLRIMELMNLIYSLTVEACH